MSKPKMRKFRVRFEGEVEIEVSDALLRSCNTDEWRESMLPYTRDEEFVQHIAYNMVLNGLDLRRIDGYADQPERSVILALGPLAAEWDVKAKEL